MSLIPNIVGRRWQLERNQEGIYGLELVLRDFASYGATVTFTREPGGVFHWHVHARISPETILDATGRTLYTALANLLDQAEAK